MRKKQYANILILKEAADVIMTPALAETAAILADIPEDTLQLYSPLDRCIILATKEMMKKKKKILTAQRKKNPPVARKKQKMQIIKVTKLRSGGQVKS